LPLKTDHPKYPTSAKPRIRISVKSGGVGDDKHKETVRQTNQNKINEMIEISDLVTYCDESYARQEEQCADCQNENCEGKCSRCFNSIHSFNSTRDYDCQNLIYHYVCEYIYAKSSEIAHLFNLHSDLNKLQELKILSIGCGPASELFGINHSLPNALITYKGFDLNSLWTDIHEQIESSVVNNPKRNVNFYNANVFDQYPELGFIPNVLILSYLISHLPKVGINVKEFLATLRDEIIVTMPVNSYIIINDTNHMTVRDNFTVLLSLLNEIGTYSANRYRFKGYSLYGERHTTDALIEPIPQKIRYKYETWRECGSTAQMVIKKEVI